MSKGLKYLNHIKNNDFNMMIATYPPIPAYNGISKQEMFNIIRKELTALEIIKEKEIDTFYLRQCFKVKDGLEKYNNCCKVGYKLKQEEFDLLKECLCQD